MIIQEIIRWYIRKVSILLNPIIPNATDKVLNVLSINTENINFESIKNHDSLYKGGKIKKLNILFKKIEKNDWFTLPFRSRAIK